MSAGADIRASVVDLVGDTPVVALDRLGRALPNRLLAKCEFMNPGGSVKDRIGRAMIDEAERTGQLRTGGTIVEATAGNTGMALAMVAARRGYRLVAVMTTKMSGEKVDLMRALGAEVVICPYEVGPGHPNHFISRARAIAAATPGGWFADQFNNGANLLAHYRTTGPELWRQTGGRIDVLVAGIGTGGTLCGAAAYLKERNPRVRAVMADPEGSILADLLEGSDAPRPRAYSVEGIGGDFLPGLARLALVDEAITIGDAEAFSTCRRLFREEGLFIGGSSGCILAAALRLAQRRSPRPLTIVAILPDGGRAYLSTIYNPDWLAARGLAEAVPAPPPVRRSVPLPCIS